MTWDVFICHATEDKEELVRPLAAELRALGLQVWYDEFSLQVGDSLRRAIDHGLSQSKAGIVVLSPSFFAKEWPQRELDGLVAREAGGEKVVLPVWHRIDREVIIRYSPTLADRVALRSTLGVATVATKLAEALRTSRGRPAPSARTPVLAVGPDGGLTQADGEAEIAIREALLNVDQRVNPPLLLTVCPELLWRFLSDREPLERLGWPWSLDIFRRLEEFRKKPSLTEDERQERLWLHAIDTQLGKSLALVHTAVSALLSEPVLRKSGYLETPADILLALKGTVSRAFWDRQIPPGMVKLDLYRLREPRLGVGIWVPRAGSGTDNPMLLTVQGGTYAGDLPPEILKAAAIPAMVLEVYRVSDKVSSYKPDPKFLALSDWFLGLG